MEARAIHRYIPTSPRKMKLVVDLIRGKGVEEAISILHFSPKHASKEAEKTLRSAIANLQNKEESGRIDFDRIFVKEAYVHAGPSMKRILPAPMGRAYRIQKRSNHLTIVVAVKKLVVPVKPPAKKKAAPKKGSETTEAKAAPRKTASKTGTKKAPAKKSSKKALKKK